jgi:hypothetical protein
VHEAGHAVVAASLGVIFNATLDADGYGGVMRCPGERVDTAADAARMATCLWAGRMAERILLPRHARLAAAECNRNEESDEAKLAALSGDYGGDHLLSALSWSLACRDRAMAILALNRRALRGTAERIFWRGRIHCMDVPLLFVRQVT